jgi:hypothetical protein
MEDVKRLKALIDKNPDIKKYFTRADFEFLACKTQSDINLLKKYHEVTAETKGYMTAQSMAAGIKEGKTVEEMKAHREASKTELFGLQQQLKAILEAGEKGVAATYWTEGGAGYEEPEETVAQPTVNIGGQEYYWTGASYSPVSQDAQAMVQQLQAQGIPPSEWADRVKGSSQEVKDYVTQYAEYLATPLETPTTIPSVSTPSTGVTPSTTNLEDWMNVDWASIYGGYVPEGYQPTVAGAGYPFVTDEGYAQAGEGQVLQEGNGWRLVKSSGIKNPSQTPEGVGWIAGDTAQAEVQFLNPLTGQWESTGKYIQLEGEQVQAGLTYLQTLETTYGGVGAGLPAGYYESPFDVPADIAQQYGIVYDPNTMLWRVGGYGGETGGEPSEFEQWYMQQQLALDQAAQALKEQQFQWEQEQAGQLTPWQQEQLDLAYDQLEQANEMTEYQAEQLRLQEEYQNWQQTEAERQYKSQLAAQPVSWLQYAAYTGEQPAIQPWMTPLMPEQYGYTSAGEPIPGWSAESMTEMPELTRPSAQYQARMGPTALQQMYGYEQARTGATPEEQAWRLWQTAPPSGQASQLSWAR